MAFFSLQTQGVREVILPKTKAIIVAMGFDATSLPRHHQDGPQMEG